MKRHPPLITLCVFSLVLLGGCIKGLGPGVKPPDRVVIHFLDKLEMAYIIEGNLAKGINRQMARDCSTPDDQSPLCLRTRSQLLPFAAKVVQAKALLDQTKDAYDNRTGEPDSLLAAVVQAVLLLNRTSRDLKLED